MDHVPCFATRIPLGEPDGPADLVQVRSGAQAGVVDVAPGLVLLFVVCPGECGLRRHGDGGDGREDDSPGLLRDAAPFEPGRELRVDGLDGERTSDRDGWAQIVDPIQVDEVRVPEHRRVDHLHADEEERREMAGREAALDERNDDLHQ